MCSSEFIPNNSRQKTCSEICSNKLHSSHAVKTARKRREKYFELKGYYPEDRAKLKAYSKHWYASLQPEKQLLRTIKCRAKTLNLPFNLELSDIIIPEFCPVLGLKLERGISKHQPNSPSCDRRIPNLGYTKNNIIFMSYKANTMKNDATPELLLKFSKWIQNNF